MQDGASFYSRQSTILYPLQNVKNVFRVGTELAVAITALLWYNRCRQEKAERNAKKTNRFTCPTYFTAQHGQSKAQ